MNRWWSLMALILAAALLALPAASEDEEETEFEVAEEIEEIAPVDDKKDTAKEIDKRMLELDAREAALRLLEADILAKIEELDLLHSAATAALLPQEEEKAEQLATLIQFYQAMKPKQAANLLEKLPASLAADLLGSMKSRTAGKILNVMNSDRAVVISRLMAGRN